MSSSASEHMASPTRCRAVGSSSRATSRALTLGRQPTCGGATHCRWWLAHRRSWRRPAGHPRQARRRVWVWAEGGSPRLHLPQLVRRLGRVGDDHGGAAIGGGVLAGAVSKSGWRLAFGTPQISTHRRSSHTVWKRGATARTVTRSSWSASARWCSWRRRTITTPTRPQWCWQPSGPTGVPWRRSLPVRGPCVFDHHVAASKGEGKVKAKAIGKPKAPVMGPWGHCATGSEVRLLGGSGQQTIVRSAHNLAESICLDMERATCCSCSGQSRCTLKRRVVVACVQGQCYQSQHMAVRQWYHAGACDATLQALTHQRVFGRYDGHRRKLYSQTLRCVGIVVATAIIVHVRIARCEISWSGRRIDHHHVSIPPHTPKVRASGVGFGSRLVCVGWCGPHSCALQHASHNGCLAIRVSGGLSIGCSHATGGCASVGVHEVLLHTLCVYELPHSSG